MMNMTYALIHVVSTIDLFISNPITLIFRLQNSKAMYINPHQYLNY